MASDSGHEASNFCDPKIDLTKRVLQGKQEFDFTGNHSRACEYCVIALATCFSQACTKGGEAMQNGCSNYKKTLESQLTAMSKFSALPKMIPQSIVCHCILGVVE